MKRWLALIALVGFCLSGCIKGLQGRVVGIPDGNPVGEATITAERQLTSAAPLPPLMTKTDAQGKFSFAGIEPGLYLLTVSREGFLSKEVPAIDISAQTGSHLIIELIHLGTVKGVVKNAAGNSVQDVEVMTADGSVIASTQPDGSFILSGIAPGSLQLVAVGQQASSGTFDYNVKPGDNAITIVLPPPSSQESGADTSGALGLSGSPALIQGGIP